MLKRIVSVIFVVAIVLVSCLPICAASYQQNGNVKTPTAISYDDLIRLQEVTATSKNCTTRIVNATSYNNSKTVWIVRIEYSSVNGSYLEDYVINVYPYGYDSISKAITTLPFKSVEEGTAIFGPSWYYFGLFDDVTHNSCGFAVAERIKRWPDWKDNTFSGVTYRGVAYTGSYPQTNDAFVADNN